MEQSHSVEFGVIREKIWKGQFLVKFEVPEHYIAGSDFPKPVYKVISRNSYLEFQNEGVNELFKSFTISSELWFGLKEKPLHWHVPFGVLIDAYLGVNFDIPIEVSAHYRAPPMDKLISGTVKLNDIPSNIVPLNGLKTVKDHYKHSVKEAAQIRFGSANVILLNTKSEDWEQLFESVKLGHMEKYEKIFNKIWFSSQSKPRAIGIRIYIKDYPNMIQKSHEFYKEDGSEILLGEYLSGAFPKLKFHWDNTENEEVRKFEVISQGILLEKDYSLYFLSENLYNLDGFVYISLHFNS